MSLHLALRRLLQVDRPVPSRTAEEIAAEVQKNYRWNFVFNIVDGATFWFGLSFISATTIVPLFISKLSDNPFYIGLAAVIAQGSWSLPQLFTANAVERLPRKKPVVVNLGFFLERVPLWVMVLAAALSLRSPGLALALFLIGYAWHGLGAGVIATAWQDMLGIIFPVEKRGRALGLTFFAGAAAGAGAASFSSWLLEHYPFPTNFVMVFVVGAAAINLSWVFLAMIREPAQPVVAPRRNSQEFRTEVARIVREDHNFRHFLVGRVLMALGAMSSGFVTVAAIQRWGIPDRTVGYYTALLLIGQTIGNLIFGFLADKRGHKLSLEVTSLTYLLAFGLAWLSPSPEWYYVVFILIGISMGGSIVSGILVALEFCAPEKRPTYVGLSNTMAGIMGSLAPMLGAALASVSYELLFALSAVVYLGSFGVMHWWVKEPRYAGLQAVPVQGEA